jgi:hypothetical protein
MKKKWVLIIWAVVAYFVWANTFFYLRDDNRLYWVWHHGRSSKVVKFSLTSEYKVPFAFSSRSFIRKYNLRKEDSFVRWMDKTMTGYIIMKDKFVIFSVGGK